MVVVLLVAVLVALCVYWPDGVRTQAIASFLQVIAALALVLLTAMYVEATNQLVKAQNRPPEIRVRSYTMHVQGSGMLYQFLVAIANPSTRATSVSALDAEIEGTKAAVVCFAFGSRSCAPSVTIPAGGLEEVTCDASFHEVPLGPGDKGTAVIKFNDIFHGDLPPVHYMI